MKIKWIDIIEGNDDGLWLTGGDETTEVAKWWRDTLGKLMTPKLAEEYILAGVFCPEAVAKLFQHNVTPQDLKRYRYKYGTNIGYWFANGDASLKEILAT